MATVPTTLVILTEDKINFPIKSALVVMKQLFQYGVNRMSVREDKIFIELSYTPNAQKLKAKFGTLPVRYMRVKLDNPDEFKILEDVVKRYRYNLLDEDVAEKSRNESATAGPSKRKIITAPPRPLPPPLSIHYGDDDDEEEGAIVEGEEEEEEEAAEHGPPTKKPKM